MFRRVQLIAIQIYGTLIKCTIIDTHIIHYAHALVHFMYLLYLQYCIRYMFIHFIVYIIIRLSCRINCKNMIITILKV